MKYIIFIALGIILSCSQNKKNSDTSKRPESITKEVKKNIADSVIDVCGQRKLTLRRLRNIDFFYNGQDSIYDSILIRRYFAFKNNFSSYIDSIENLVSKLNAEDPGLDLFMYFPKEKCISSLKSFIATEDIVYIYGSPIFEPWNIVDSVNIFDHVIVPFANKDAFRANRPDEAFMGDYRNLCYYNGKFGFYFNNQCIGSSRIEQFTDLGYTLFKGNKTVIRKHNSNEYFIIPAEKVAWSSELTNLVYVVHGEDRDKMGNRLPEIFMFDIVKWENSFLTKGNNPDFLNLKNSFFYYNTNPENVFLAKSINLFEIDSLKARILINLPDSLNCGSWGVDFYHPSKINMDSISDSACYSVFLHVIPENDEYMDQPFYNTFFNLEGEILRIDMKK